MIEFFQGLDTSSLVGLIVSILVGVSAFIQISPIKINPWSWIARKVGHAINGEVIEKVDKLEKDIKGIGSDVDSVRKDVDSVKSDLNAGLQKVRDENEEEKIVNKRVRILRFGDEIRHEQRHSKDHFDQIMMDVTEYESYCESHPNFKNDITVMTIEIIKKTYKNCLEKDSFL